MFEKSQRTVNESFDRHFRERVLTLIDPAQVFSSSKIYSFENNFGRFGKLVHELVFQFYNMTISRSTNQRIFNRCKKTGSVINNNENRSDRKKTVT